MRLLFYATGARETYVFISTYEARANRDAGLTVHAGGRGDFRQKLLADKPEHRIGFAFISGTLTNCETNFSAASSAVR
jgi:hypothetical protein